MKQDIFTKYTDVSYQENHLAIDVELDIQKYVSKTSLCIICFSKKLTLSDVYTPSDRDMILHQTNDVSNARFSEITK